MHLGHTRLISSFSGSGMKSERARLVAMWHSGWRQEPERRALGAAECAGAKRKRCFWLHAQGKATAHVWISNSYL